MGFRRKIIYQLVHKGKLSNKQAQQFLKEGKVRLNGEVVYDNLLWKEGDELSAYGLPVVAGKKFLYLKFYKPRGFVSSLNKKVENNISGFFQNPGDIQIAGRLDKDSEGLLLLSNDGKWIQRMIHPHFAKEKEYIVELDREPDAGFFRSLSKGVDLGNYVTKSCFSESISGRMIRIILTEGKNRQIRRMCKKLGYSVQKLLRIRIDDIGLGDLAPGRQQILNL